MQREGALNIPVLPGAPLPIHEHKKMIWFAIAAIILAVLAFAWYWTGRMEQNQVEKGGFVAVEKQILPDSVIQQLSTAPQPTAAEIKAGLKRLSAQSSKASLSSADKQAALDMLRAQTAAQ